jgi:hypothetical protein
MQLSSRRLLDALGSFLALAGVVFVIIQIVRHGAELNVSQLDSRLWLAAGVCSLLYAAANYLLASGWKDLLQQWDPAVPGRVARAVYGKSLPAKYVPGNFLHLASRQAVGAGLNINGWALAKASLYELVLIALASIPYSILLLPQMARGVTVGVSVVLFGIAGIGMAAVIGAGFGHNPGRAFLKHLLFLAVSACIFVALMALVAAEPGLAFAGSATIAGGYVVAWSAGLITPGAPAGIGVRELVLITSLSGLAERPEILTAVLISRLITIVGDVLFYCLSCRKWRKSSDRV